MLPPPRTHSEALLPLPWSGTLAGAGRGYWGSNASAPGSLRIDVLAAAAAAVASARPASFAAVDAVTVAEALRACSDLRTHSPRCPPPPPLPAPSSHAAPRAAAHSRSSVASPVAVSPSGPPERRPRRLYVVPQVAAKLHACFDAALVALLQADASAVLLLLAPARLGDDGVRAATRERDGAAGDSGGDGAPGSREPLAVRTHRALPSSWCRRLRAGSRGAPGAGAGGGDVGGSAAGVAGGAGTTLEWAHVDRLYGTPDGGGGGDGLGGGRGGGRLHLVRVWLWRLRVKWAAARLASHAGTHHPRDADLEAAAACDAIDTPVAAQLLHGCGEGAEGPLGQGHPPGWRAAVARALWSQAGVTLVPDESIAWQISALAAVPAAHCDHSTPADTASPRGCSAQLAHTLSTAAAACRPPPGAAVRHTAGSISSTARACAAATLGLAQGTAGAADRYTAPIFAHAHLALACPPQRSCRGRS